jgi:hypothetical protein
VFSSSSEHAADRWAPASLIGENESVGVLEWLAPGQYDDRHNEIKRGRIKGTGRWLLDSANYKHWCSESDAASFLWCHGGPGAGKTFLAYWRPPFVYHV